MINNNMEFIQLKKYEIHFNKISQNQERWVKVFIRCPKDKLDEIFTLLDCGKCEVSYQKTNPNRFKYLHYGGMPSFTNNPDLIKYGKFMAICGSEEDKQELGRILGKKIAKGKARNPSVWWPKRWDKPENMEWITTTPQNPQYPIYIISKGRWKKRLTADCLDKMGVPFKMVVEPDEYHMYVKYGMEEDKLLKLPQEYMDMKSESNDVEPYTKCGASIPARLFSWDNSIENGFEKHWILDDNIADFRRWNDNTKFRMRSGVCFKIVEDYTARFDNVYLSGIQYQQFCPEIDMKRPPIIRNSRCYSCILIKNDCPHRWRGCYNEDTDLSLRVLKDGYPTILFNQFLCDKKGTMSMKGGNTTTIYSSEIDGLKRKFLSLKSQHPYIVFKSNRFQKPYHHFIDYRKHFSHLQFKPKQEFYQHLDEIGEPIFEEYDYNMKLEPIETSTPTINVVLDSEVIPTEGEDIIQNQTNEVVNEVVMVVDDTNTNHTIDDKDKQILDLKQEIIKLKNIIKLLVE